MKKLRSILLMPSPLGAATIELANAAGVALDAKIANDLDTLERVFTEIPELLLSFGTGVIVPSAILELPGLIALNVHAASPQYPGRDPHHFAIYDAAKQYGATLHYMTNRVDAGPIVDVELFDVPVDITPSELLSRANDAGHTLIERLFSRLFVSGAPKPMEGVAWGTRKSTRKMFIEMCKVDSAISADEFRRRQRATEMPGYNNLFIDLHGSRFRIEGPV